MKSFPEERVRAIFLIAGLEVQGLWKLQNGYWPYPEAHEASPWWLVQTQFGNICIGWRKRVLSIDWSSTGIECIVTEDLVTKDKSMVHAWTELDAIKYLQALNCDATIAETASA